MSAFQAYLDRREDREKKARKEGQEEIIKALEEVLEKNQNKKLSNEDLIQAVQSACSYSRDNK